MESAANMTLVLVRTTNSLFQGNVAVPVRTRLKEFLARPQSWVALSDVLITTSAPGESGIPERVREVTLFKRQIQFISTLDEVKTAEGKIYERDVMAARIGKESFSFQLSAGYVISGEIVGGEQIITFHKGSFLAVTQPRITDLRGRELGRELSFVLLNLDKVECFRQLSRSASPTRERVLIAKEKPEVDMDFSDFENQFITLDKLVNVQNDPSGK